MKTLAFATFDNLIVLYHSHHDPSDEEWNEVIQACHKGDESLDSLVITHGGAPSVMQRQRLARMFKAKGLNPNTAVVTDSKWARGAVTALSWLGRRIKAFAHGELDSALDYLNIESNQRDSVKNTISQLEESVKVADATPKKSLWRRSVSAPPPSPNC